MGKTISVQTDPKTGETYIDISAFADLIDIKKVKYHRIIPIKDGNGSLEIRFFDAKKKRLKTIKQAAMRQCRPCQGKGINSHSLQISAWIESFENVEKGETCPHCRGEGKVLK